MSAFTKRFHDDQKPSKYTFQSYLKEDVFSNYRILAGLAAILIFAAFLIISSVQAEGSSTPKHKYYKSVQISAGDTLWGIAADYMTEEYSSVHDYIREVKDINGIQNDQITNGSSIVIPYYSEDLH